MSEYGFISCIHSGEEIMLAAIIPPTFSEVVENTAPITSGKSC